MGHILIVDDDEIARIMLGRILQDAGYEVAYAGDGNAALARLGRQSFDVIVTDLAMPGMNGLRLIQHLARSHGSTPVIAISGQNAEQLLLAEDFGASATLFKPVDPRELLEAVDRLHTVATSAWDNVWN